jgi:hypothetical protein
MSSCAFYDVIACNLLFSFFFFFFFVCVLARNFMFVSALGTATLLAFLSYTCTKKNYICLPSRQAYILSLPKVPSTVGIETGYGLDFAGYIPDRSKRDFSPASRPALEHTQSPIQCVPGLFPGVKAAGE